MRKDKDLVKKRNLLCVKDKERLELGHLLLYEPYKNILIKFKELCTEIDAKDFDPVAKVYDGLLSVPAELKEYYESLLGVTSHYSHSQGGKGKYIEKKIASSYETCSLSIEISQIPFWLENPGLHKKKGIFTQKGLIREEKKKFRTTEWDWIGDRDVNIDVGSVIIHENALILIEIKNRVDTGGTAGRREIWTSEKFGIFVEYLNSNKKLFRKNDKTLSFAEVLESFGIKCFELYIGILFDKKDKTATVKSDMINGFYSSSKRGFEYIKGLVKQSSTLSLVKKDDYNLQMEISLNYSGMKVKIGALYGNDIPLKLFRKKLPVSKLLLLKYDDMWLSQLLTIDERAILLKHNKNCMTLFIDLLKKDRSLREKYDDLIISESGEDELIAILSYLNDKYSDVFIDELIPFGNDKDRYLADVIQVLCACDA